MVLLAAVLSGPPGWAQSVTLSGAMGLNKALLMIDGQPQMLAVGASARGVTLRRLGDGEAEVEVAGQRLQLRLGDRKSTRLNSSHSQISYAVFCLKKYYN